MKHPLILATAAFALAAATQGLAATVTITNSENEDLFVYAYDQNAAGPQVLPASGGGCTLVPAGSSVTVNAAADSNGAYSLSWTAEQNVPNPLVKTSTCSANTSQSCQVDMASAQPATPHCQ